MTELTPVSNPDMRGITRTPTLIHRASKVHTGRPHINTIAQESMTELIVTAMLLSTTTKLQTYVATALGQSKHTEHVRLCAG